MNAKKAATWRPFSYKGVSDLYRAATTLTVFAKDCATADAIATSMMVMGIDSARVLCERHPELGAYFIYQTPDGEIATSSTPGLEF
ncbi:MAG: FAD:protein FMN transferase [Bacteroidaceae bacterium]|nr:FAD:protein FMN transferase [Bacteroidaceae bacterium]